MSSWPSAVDAVEKAGELGVWARGRVSLDPSCASAAGGSEAVDLGDDVFAGSCTSQRWYQSPCSHFVAQIRVGNSQKHQTAEQGLQWLLTE